MNKTLKEVLKKMELSESEIDIYWLALENGPIPVGKLAKKTRISRPNLYKVMENLEKKGLGSFSSKDRYKRKFIASSPSVIFAMFRDKLKHFKKVENEMKNAIPDLLSLFKQGEAKTKVQVLYGKEDFVRIFWQILEEEKTEIVFIGSVTDFINFISWQEERGWIQKRIKNGTLIKALVFPGVDTKILKDSDSIELRETRILKDIDFFNTSFQVFANKVIIWQPKTPLAILIEDEYITKMFKSIFQKIWDVSK